MDVESRLLDIWSSLLGTRQIDVNDNFFSVGGTSLLALSVTSKILDELRVDVSVPDFFESPTIAGLATLVSQRRSQTQGASVDPTRPLFRSLPAVTKVPSFRRTTWEGIKHGRLGVDSTNGPHAVVSVHAPLVAEAAEHAFAALVARHDVLRATIAESDGIPWLCYGAANPQLERIELASSGLEQRWEEARAIASQRVWAPFDVARGPICRAFWIRVTANEHVFGLVVHHFVSDAASIDVLLREFLGFCRRACSGDFSHPKNVDLQYRDYLLAMSEWLAGAEAQAQLTYWSARLADAPPTLPPPHGCDAPAPRPIPSELFESSSEAFLGVRAAARRLETTPSVFALASSVVALARLTGQLDITIGSVTNGRELPELRGLVGYLADRVYYRFQLGGDPEFAEIVRLVHAAVRENLPRQFIRSDILRQRLLDVGSQLVAPVLNFIPAAMAATDDDAASDDTVLARRFPVDPPPVDSGPIAGMRYWMHLHETPNGFRGRVRYNGPPVPGLVETFCSVLDGAAKDCRRRLATFTARGG